jgi:hypothetical protein
MVLLVMFCTPNIIDLGLVTFTDNPLFPQAVQGIL